MIHKSAILLITVLFAVCFMAVFANAEQLTVVLNAGSYEIVELPNQLQQIKMDDFGNLLTPGNPMLPAKTFLIALPPGAEVFSVNVTGMNGTELPGAYKITPAPPVAPSDPRQDLIKESMEVWKHNYESSYSSDQVYPAEVGWLAGTGGLRKYTFVRVTYTPFAYQPLSGKLIFYSSASVSIDYSLPPAGSQKAMERLLSDTVADELASKLFVNYNEAKQWYIPRQAVSGPEQPYSYVIITIDNLQSAVSSLVTWKQSIGYTVNVVLVSWINSTYPGADLPEKIRNFLIDKYQEWSIEYVLLVGDISNVPMRYCYPKPNDPNEDTPTDYYYADLTGNWNSDGDSYYGEYGEDNVDWVPEVIVGRIPWSDASTVSNICQKIVNFEGDTGNWKNNAMLLGAISNYQNEDFQGVDRTCGHTLMELKKDFINNIGGSWTTMYEQSGINPCTTPCTAALTNANVVSYWSSGQYGMVNWWAHGSQTTAERKWWSWDNGNNVPEASEMSWARFIGTVDCPSLNDQFPSIVFANSCNNGWPEVSNLGKNLLRLGSASIVASSRISWYSIGWQNQAWGGNASIDYFFFDYMINLDEKVGDALFDSKVYYSNNFFFPSWGWVCWQNMFDFNLYGDPALYRPGTSGGGLNPPQNLYAFKGYNGAVPLAWDAPTGYTPLDTLVDVSETSDGFSGGNNASHTNEKSTSIDNDPAPNQILLSYNVYRSTTPGGPYLLIASGVNRQYYRDETVANGVTYYYVVTAVYDAGESGYSNEDDGLPVAGGYYINSGWAAAPPILDGFINPAEWSSADVIDITYPGVTPSVTLYVMNDNGHLYVAVDDPGNLSLEDLDQIGIYFDDDYNREWPPSSPSGEGNFWIEWFGGTALTDFRGIYGWWPGNMGFDPSVTAAGVNQAISTFSGHVQYEVDVDLAVSELNAGPGDVIGYRMYSLIQTAGYNSGYWPQELVFCPWSDAWRLPAVYGDLELACEGFGVDVVIPDTTGIPGTLVDIPMKVITDVTGMGVIAAEIELSWDYTVVDNASAAPGTMVPANWLFNYTSTPGSGQMTIWMAGTEDNPPTDDLAGTGCLVMLTFDVVGQHCDTTTIHFNKMVFNEGDPPAITHDGLFHAFAGWDITGNIYYCMNNQPVDDAIVPALGTSYKDTTDIYGDYALLDLPPDNYVVKPEKEDDIGTPSAISAFDAAWILQYGVGLRTFEPCQMIAADVSGNGTVSAFDAAKILQWGVGIITHFPVMPDPTHFWRFVPDDSILTLSNWMVAPDAIAYTPLNSNVVDDYKAILYGDVSGNWHPTDGGLVRSAIATVDIRLENVYGKSGDRISLPIYVDNASDIIAMNFTLAYDPQVLKAVGASLSSLTQDYLIAHAVKDGQIRVGLAGSKPIVGSGAVVNLEFEVLDTESPDATSLMEITQMVINDGSIAANIQAARFEMGSPVPDEYALHQNYPNPFNPVTLIKYQLPQSGRVVLKIYNAIGQDIRTLVNEEKKAGYHEIRWDGRDNNGVSVSSGVYIYRIQAGDFVSSKKMILMM